MTADGPRQRRDEWPWVPVPSAARRDDDAVGAAAAEVDAAALEVGRMTEALGKALERLHAAQRDARLTAECSAAREAGQTIARARQGLA